jgi:hypothetical protein
MRHAAVHKEVLAHFRNIAARKHLLQRRFRKTPQCRIIGQRHNPHMHTFTSHITAGASAFVAPPGLPA